MFRKKLFLLCSTLIIAASTLTPTIASAHHHSSGRNYSACKVTNCTSTGKHYHNGRCYNGHTAKGNHTCRQHH